jgi:hypothetical protein
MGRWRMSEFPHEEGVWDLDEDSVLDPADTLEGDVGDDPLDQGVTLPDRWSPALRHVLEGDEETESLEELLAEEDPDITLDSDEESWDENATSEDVVRKERALGQERRTGRLVARNEEVYDGSDTSFILEDQLTPLDVGIDGGAATAEEAAVHVIDEDAGQDTQ